ncbi:MFS transporter [Actinomadura kijaniata]|uniref:MFS transporter n=1 Tax=Actinomadura kijaniata TaxID=46161 RepID=UPI003F19A32C
MTRTTTPPPRAARRAVATVFFLNGAVFSSWVPRIPEVRDALGLGDGALGAALLGPALGAVAAMSAAGALVSRHGSRPVVRAALAAFCAVPVLIGLASTWAALVAALTVWGAAMGTLDVAMNSAGMAVQARYPRPVMSGLHGCFSLGALVGAGTGAFAAHLRLPVPWHLLAAGAAALVLGAVATRALLPAGDDALHTGPAFARPTRPLMLLAALAFAGLLAEGAAVDWSALYLRDVLGAGAGTGGAGYAAFTLAMTAGRLTGDRLVAACGPVRVVRWLAALAATGFAAALLVAEVPAALAGLALLGLGLACVVPIVFTAAGHAAGPSAGGPGPAIAAVSSCGYLGFIAGPPLIGVAAEAVGLGGALGLVAMLVALLALGAPAVAPAGRARPRRVPASPARGGDAARHVPDAPEPPRSA